MQFRFRTLLAVSDSQRDFGLVLISLGIIAVGLFFILTPAQHLVQSDWRTRRYFYEAEMKASSDRNRAIAAAGLFYKLFGGLLIVFGLGILTLAWIPS